jgi:hypothetical protein
VSKEERTRRKAGEGKAERAAANPVAGGEAQAPPADGSQEELFRMIQERAFEIAQRDGFVRDPTDYWIQAEKEIEARLKK